MIAITVADKNNASVNTYVPDVDGSLVAARVSSWLPRYDGHDDSLMSMTVDEDGNLNTRAQVLTDEGGFRVNFANASTWASIGTLTFTNGSDQVTSGTNLLDADLNIGDYIRLDSDGSQHQVYSITSDTIVLEAAYTGTSGTGAASRSKIMQSLGAGSTFTVSNGAALFTSGTTAGAVSYIARSIDVPSLVANAQITLSQRIANQTFYFGFSDNPDITAAKSYALFAFDGTTATAAKLQTARNPVNVPTGGEIQTTALTITTTATASEFRLELLRDRAMAFQADTLRGTNKVALPSQSDMMYFVCCWVNGGTAPASTTTATIDFAQVANNNELAVSFITREAQPVNTALINGIAPSMGSGTNGTGVQRVTLATDQAACSVAGLFSVKLDQTTQGTTNLVTNGPAAVTGVATTVSAQASLATPNIKATPGCVYGYSIVNKDAAMLYLQFYNTAGTPTRGTSVVWWVPVGPSQTVHVAPSPIALNFHSTGIGIAAATTPTGAVAPTTAPDVVVYFK